MTDVTDTGGHPIDAFAAGEHMDEDRLERHISGLASDEEVRAAERHLLLCRECRHALVETATRRRAAARRRRIRFAVPITTAAALVIAFGVTLRRPGTPDQPVSRGGQVRQAFSAISPIGEAMVPPDSVALVWASAGAGAYYSLTLADAEGEVVWSTEIADTTVQVPADVSLRSGAHYYWFVDAFLDGANTATTGVQEFQVR